MKLKNIFKTVITAGWLCCGAAAALMTLAACSDDDPIGSLATVSLDQTYLVIPETGGDVTLTLDQFYRWGRQMISDFTNVDASMHAEEVANFFDNAIAAHELGQWQLDPEVEDRLRALIGVNIGRNEEKDYFGFYIYPGNSCNGRGFSFEVC